MVGFVVAGPFVRGDRRGISVAHLAFYLKHINCVTGDQKVQFLDKVSSVCQAFATDRCKRHGKKN